MEEDAVEIGHGRINIIGLQRRITHQKKNKMEMSFPPCRTNSWDFLVQKAREDHVNYLGACFVIAELHSQDVLDDLVVRLEENHFEFVVSLAT